MFEFGSGTSTLTYTGLEPILDNLNAVDRRFEFVSGSDETITLTAGGLMGQDLLVDSTAGESVSFNEPTSRLRLDTTVGSGADEIIIAGLNAGFSADLVVEAGRDSVLANNDTVAFRTTPTTIGTPSDNSSVSVTAATTLFEVDVAVDGSLYVDATADINVSSNVAVSASRNITLLADNDVAIGVGARVVADSDGSLSGILIIAADHDGSGTGDVTADPTSELTGTLIRVTGFNTSTGLVTATNGSATISAQNDAILNAATQAMSGSVNVVAAAGVLRSFAAITADGAVDLNAIAGMVRLETGATLSAGTSVDIDAGTRFDQLAGNDILAGTDVSIDAADSVTIGGTIGGNSPIGGDVRINQRVGELGAVFFHTDGDVNAAGDVLVTGRRSSRLRARSVPAAVLRCELRGR